MSAYTHICRIARICIATALTALFCVGCGLSQSTFKPISPPIITQPVSHPISQPGSPPIIQPISQPGSQPISGVISLSGSAEQQAIIKSALGRCTFPFERLKSGLQRAGVNSVNISWRQMGKGTMGWASTGGEIGINNTISGIQAQRTAILELGHIVDFFYLTPEMRKEITKLWHPDKPDNHAWLGSADYWSQNGEAYSTLFLWAFADEELWFDAGYSHKPSEELATKLRAILIPKIAEINSARN